MSKGSANRTNDFKSYRDCPLWDKPRAIVEECRCPRCNQRMKSESQRIFHEENCIYFATPIKNQPTTMERAVETMRAFSSEYNRRVWKINEKTKRNSNNN